MSNPTEWTPEEAERLGRIASGACPHLSTLTIHTAGDDDGMVVCMNCFAVVGTEPWT